jgi:hypothetical protein
MTQALTVGYWYIRKYRNRAKDSNDYFGVAKCLRKQGVPLEVAMLILFGGNRGC